MVSFGSEFIDFAPLWTWILFMTRFTGVFLGIPGVGTEQVPASFRLWPAVLISLGLTLTGIRAPEPTQIGEMLTMLGSEISLGYLLGALPGFVLGGLAVSGQVIAGAIGLGQANMIDPSLGGNVSVIARLKTMIATAVFLIVDGHHVIIKAASGIPGEAALGLFRPGYDTANILVDQLVLSFEFALTIAAPVLVTTLVTQFVLGLITKFVPQINIFIISLPLSVFVGLFILSFSFPQIAQHTQEQFTSLQETIGVLFPPLQSNGETPQMAPPDRAKLQNFSLLEHK